MIKNILKAIQRLYEIPGSIYLAPILLREWKAPSVREINERPIEYGFAANCLTRTCPEEVLDIGSGRSAWPHLMANCGFRITAIDKREGYWNFGFSNRHYYIKTDDITRPKISKQFDLITCISVLEHVPDHRAAIKGMFSLLKNGGYIVLTFPYNKDRYVDNVYKLPEAGYGKNAPYICQIFSRKELEVWTTENPGSIVAQEYWRVFSGELWTFGKRIYPPCQVTEQEEHHLACVLIQKT